jgi:dephospho-CoA kinase
VNTANCMSMRLRSPKFVLGVTGSIGSGKSTVSRMFARCGAEVVDADALARACLRPGHPVYRRVARLFGPSVIGRSGRMDRQALGDIVFTSGEKVAALNALVHPCVLKEIRKRVRRSTARFVVIDAPLLVESGLLPDVDSLVVVRVSPRVRIARMLSKGVDVARVNARLRNQLPQKKKEALADYIVNNDGEVGGTKQQVVKIWHELRQKQQSTKTKQK